MYCEEVDWCWRIRKAGWTIYTVPRAEIVHYGGESTSQIPARSILNLWRSRAQLYQKHHGKWRNRLARMIVRSGLARKAEQTEDEQLQSAYRESAVLWQKDMV